MAFPPYHESQLENYVGHDGKAWSRSVPFQRPHAKTFGSFNANLTYAQHELLRQRKTPQGRQTETLDLANIDDTLELPASKHLLLSVSPGNNRFPPERSTFNVHQQHNFS